MHNIKERISYYFNSFTARQAIFLIIILSFITYFFSLFNGFVWDDIDQIVNNSLVHSVNNISIFFTGSTFDSGGNGSLSGVYYKPLLSLSYSIIYTVFGNQAFFFHLAQLGLYTANCILIFLIFKKFFGKKLSLLITIFFLIHPINTESVLYISALQDVLFFFWGILALYLIQKDKLYKYTHILVPIFLLLSILSKETGVLFFLLIPSYLYLFRKNLLKLYVFLEALIFGIYMFLRFEMANIPIAKNPIPNIDRASLLVRLLTIPKIFSYYLFKVIFPVDLSISQQWTVTKPTLTDFFVPLLILLLVLFSLVFITIKIYRTKNPQFFKIYVFFIIWFSIGMLLHLDIFPLDMTVANRWFYFPFIGLLGLIGTILLILKNNGFNLRLNITSLSILGITLLLLFLRTEIRIPNWKDNNTLFYYDVRNNTESYDLNAGYGSELVTQHRYPEAVSYLKKSIQEAPMWWINWNNLGAAYIYEHNYKDAIFAYSQAIKNGNFFESYSNLGGYYILHGYYQQSRDLAYKALKYYPENENLWLILIASDYKLGNKDTALKESEEGYQLFQDDKTLTLYNTINEGQNLNL